MVDYWLQDGKKGVARVDARWGGMMIVVVEEEKEETKRKRETRQRM